MIRDSQAIDAFQQTKLLETIQKKTWKQVSSANWVLQVCNSEKPIMLFLDENDSDFNSYLLDILKSDPSALSYYIDYVHLKKRQKTFAQTILSALFLESKNIRTGTSFARDVTRVVRKAVRLIDYNTLSEWKHIRTDSVYEVFSAFLDGTEKWRAVSIELLKCMKCHSGDLRRFRMTKDLRKQDDAARFFSDIVSCFLLSGELDRSDCRQKFVACLGNVPLDELYPFDLLISGLPELFEQINPKLLDQRLKLYLVSKGNLINDYSDLDSTSYRSRINRLIEDYRDLPASDLFEIIDVPLISDANVVADVVNSVVKELGSLDVGLGPMVSDLIPDDLVKGFSNTLKELTNGKVRVIDISKGLLTLLGAAIYKYPIALTSDDLHNLFSS